MNAKYLFINPLCCMSLWIAWTCYGLDLQEIFVVFETFLYAHVSKNTRQTASWESRCFFILLCMHSSWSFDQRVKGKVGLSIHHHLYEWRVRLHTYVRSWFITSYMSYFLLFFTFSIKLMDVVWKTRWQPKKGLDTRIKGISACSTRSKLSFEGNPFSYA